MTGHDLAGRDQSQFLPLRLKGTKNPGMPGDVVTLWQLTD